MSKSVLISIQPKWCELIVNGKKTVEVRKSRPKIETPFKCYIYCSKNGISIYGDGKSYVTDNANLLNKSAKEGFETTSGFSKWNGKVIGEFMCKEIEELKRNTVFNAPALYSQSRLTRDEYFAYIGNKTAYIWYISDLKVYDKPRELGKFRVVDDVSVKTCEFRKITGQPEYKTAHNGWIKGSYICLKRCDTDWCTKCKTKPISKPPQSWCYVEEREENA